MLFLIDANVLIEANRDYYPLSRVPEFWDWLMYQGEIGSIKIPLEMYEEVVIGEGVLVEWLLRTDVRDALVLQEESDPTLVDGVVSIGYAADLADDEQLKLGRDPFLVAYARSSPADRCVVTTEVSKPSKKRANRHVPDVCTANGVQCCNTFELTRRLDFSTRWTRPST